MTRRIAMNRPFRHRGPAPGRVPERYGPYSDASLGDLPYDRDPAGPMLTPGLGVVPEWINNYTSSNYPFVVGITSVQVLPANPLRAYILIQNKHAASDMFVNFGQKATTFNGIIIIPRGNFELIGGANGGSFVPSDSIWILGAVAAMNGVVMEGVLPPVISG